MFKKKPNIKPFAPLRSSDRRKIADQIIKDFGIDVSSHTDASGSDQNSNDDLQPTLTLNNVRKSLLPDNALSARFTTTSGPDLKQVSGTVYAGAHPEEEQRILWYRIEERLLPTVYTLWRNSHIVPLLYTPDFVVQKLQSGSPLMTPGLAGGPPFPAKAVKGAIVAIASIDRPTVPVVVGTCEIEVASLGRVQGSKGHAVRSEHWEGDELWSWSTSGRAGSPAPEHIDAWEASAVENGLEQGVEDVDIEDEEDEANGGVPLPAVTQEDARNHHITGEEIGGTEQAEEQKPLSTKEIDDIFWQAFLYGIYDSTRKHRDDPRHGLSFPIPQSLVVSNLVLPYLPIHAHTHAAALNIRKTSWKNTRKFIKALDKAKLLKSKDRDGGECVVLDIDFNDPTFLNFKTYKLPKKSTSSAESGGGGGEKAVTSSSSTSDSSLGQRLQILTLYRPKDLLSPIFESIDANTKSLYHASELRSVVTGYIESENLISDTNKRLVNLNPILANAVFDGKTALDREVIAKGSVPRDALIDRVREACSQHYVILRNDEPRENAKAKSGKPPKVQIVLETRSGNKTVTKVSNVEVFYVNPKLLSDELQKSCAGSTSVGQLVGSSPKNPIMEIMVQGPQRESVIKALEKRGVDRRWIEVADKTKGKKKG